MLLLGFTISGLVITYINFIHTRFEIKTTLFYTEFYLVYLSQFITTLILLIKLFYTFKLLLKRIIKFIEDYRVKITGNNPHQGYSGNAGNTGSSSCNTNANKRPCGTYGKGNGENNQEGKNEKKENKQTE